nr:hypothetical protein [uncultured Cellulosilyticum sp.]
MEDKEIYMKLLLYASYLLMAIGIIRVIVVVISHEMSNLGLPVLIFVVGALSFINYKNMSKRM